MTFLGDAHIQPVAFLMAYQASEQLLLGLADLLPIILIHYGCDPSTLASLVFP